jgi:hypothetical protein
MKIHEDCFLFIFEFRMATSIDIAMKPNHIIMWCDKNMAVEEN